MFPSHKRFVQFHINGEAVRTTADHPFYVEGKGWVRAADMPGAKCEDEKVAPNSHEQAMPARPFVGFVAGTKVMTARGLVSIEDIGPGDMIPMRPDENLG